MRQECWYLLVLTKNWNYKLFSFTSHAQGVDFNVNLLKVVFHTQNR